MKWLLPQIARSFSIPLAEGVRTRRKVMKELKEAEELQWLSYNEIIERQWPKIERLLRNAYKWIPYYRKKFDEWGVRLDHVQAPEDLRELPILTKEDINNHREEMVDPRYRGKVYLNMTGGSTGVPTRFYQTTEHWVKSTAATIKNYRWCGFEEGEKFLTIWGHDLDVKKSQKFIQRLKDFLTNRRTIPILNFDQRILVNAIHKLRQFKPSLVVGYNTYLVPLAEKMLDMGVRDVRPKAVISTANTLMESQRKLIEAAFCAPVFDRYGARELGCIACECEYHQGYHINMENVYVEFEPLPGENRQDKNGERLYRLICTSLGNKGMPFIRYEIGDLGIPGGNECQCGRGLPIINKLKGRTHDMLRTPSGRIITGDLFDIVFEHYAGTIKQFQVRQTAPDIFKVMIVPSVNYNEETFGMIVSVLKDIIGDDVKLEIVLCDEIPVSKSGKLHLTISEL